MVSGNIAATLHERDRADPRPVCPVTEQDGRTQSCINHGAGVPAGPRRDRSE